MIYSWCRSTLSAHPLIFQIQAKRFPGLAQRGAWPLARLRALSCSEAPLNAPPGPGDPQTSTDGGQGPGGLKGSLG